MTATERIRAMLDERGVEYIENDFGITWSYYNDPHTATESMDGTLIVTGLTPEQAIEATLGRGKCRLIPTRDKPRSKKPTLTCSECGWWTDRINDEWRYCPSCGKRVKA